MKPIIVDDLVQSVRDQVDEDSSSSVSDSFILRCLNRAQRKLVHIVSKRYDDMFVTYVDQAVSTESFTIPEKAFGKKVEKIDVIEDEQLFRVRRINYRISSRYKFNTVGRPQQYSIMSNKVYLYPTPESGTTVRIYYTARPEQLDKSQGRITSIGTNVVTVDSIGDSLSTSVDDLTAFVSIIDSQTGEIRSAHQIASINTTTNQITFKSTGLNRTSLYGLDIATSLASTVALDDYVTLIGCSCVPLFVSDYSDYFIQFAVVEVKRKLQEPIQEEVLALQQQEQEVERMWAGREQQTRVFNRNPWW